MGVFLVPESPHKKNGSAIVRPADQPFTDASFSPRNGEPHHNGKDNPAAAKNHAPGKMQAARYEYKYLIIEKQADRLRPEILMYLYPDEFTENTLGRGYLVNSLYLDSPSLKTFWDTEQGARNRFKLRIRFYNDNPDSPAFLEVKKRREEIIYKTRAMVTKESVDRYIRCNVLPTERDLLNPGESNVKGLLHFNHLVTHFMARPAAYTSYYREGFEPKKGNYDRVTFDRDLRTGPITDRLTIAGREKWKIVQMGPRRDSIVYEMKFTDVFPRWMQALAERHNLVREAFQKYGGCMKVMNPRYAHLSPTFCDVPDDCPGYQGNGNGWSR